MGRRDRERIRRIQLGLENPLSDKTKTKFCLLCHTPVENIKCRQHIKECWGMDIPLDQPIPPIPPKEAVEYFLCKKVEREQAEQQEALKNFEESVKREGPPVVLIVEPKPDI